MRRRKLIFVLGGAAAAWPLAVRAQQKAMLAIGYLNFAPPGPRAAATAACLGGLGETGYVDEQNVAIEYHWAEGRADRLPASVAELVGRKVDVTATTGGTPEVLAAKAATSTIPIVFTGSGDLVVAGVVTSLARPGDNITGFSVMGAEMMTKRFELLSELAPQAGVIALLVNPCNPTAEPQKMSRLHELNPEPKKVAAAATHSVALSRTKLFAAHPKSEKHGVGATEVNHAR